MIARAPSSAARLELLDFLAQGERGLDALARVAGQSIANTSKYLQQLRSAGSVQARHDGKHVRYSLEDDKECAQGHLAGALHRPLERLQERRKEISIDRELVAYCPAPGVCLRSRPWPGCGRRDSKRVVSKTGCPSGAGPPIVTDP